MAKENKINASIGNPYIKDESEVEKYRELQDWLDSFTTCFEMTLCPDKVIMRYCGKRTFKYPAKVTLEWLQTKVEYMVENNI